MKKTTDTKTAEKKVLKVCSFTHEVRTMALAYQEKHPEVKVGYSTKLCFL